VCEACRHRQRSQQVGGQDPQSLAPKSGIRGMDGQAQCSSPPQQVLRDLSDSG
ncbi:unnamed protein product, partial [Symbiodinium necroappetens]